MENINIALLQLPQINMDLDAALEEGLNACKIAKSKGADIVLFPEMWSIGYMPPFENAFDVPDETGHDTEINHWNSLALDENSYFISRFKECARELQIAILITYLKKGEQKPFNSSMLIDMNGNTVLNYSKVHTCDFSMESFCQSGDSFNVSKLSTVKGNIDVGVMICFDREFPESARTLALKGAELILVPNCCPIDENRRSQLRSRAFENMVGIAMANYSGDSLGHSMAFDGMAYNDNGQYRDMLMEELKEEKSILVVSFDIDALRDYRSREAWGAKYRKPYAYEL